MSRHLKKQFSIRAYPVDKVRWQSAADALGMSLSAWIERALNGVAQAQQKARKEGTKAAKE